MSNKEYIYFPGSDVYAYPSANSDDGGDVNTEKNLSGITDHLVYKNFVVKNKKKTEPFNIRQSTGLSFTISDGSIVLEGRYVNFSYGSIDLSLDSFNLSLSHDSTLENWINIYLGNVNVDKKIKDKAYTQVSKGCPHLIFRLLKDVTGNMQGDLNERENGVINRVNRGVGLSLKLGSDLENLDTPYVDLGFFILDSTGSTIIRFDRNPDFYAYLDEDFIISADGIDLKTWITNYVDGKVPSDRLNCWSTNNTGTYLQSTLVLDYNDLKITRYLPSSEFNNEGYLKTQIDTHYDNTYSIDNIQKRTHVASDNQNKFPIDNVLAKHIDSNDTGEGGTWVHPDGDNRLPFETDNGHSILLARSDHSHDKAYLMSASTNTSDDPQIIGTPLKVNKNLSAKSGSIDDNFSVGKTLSVTDIQGTNLSINNPSNKLDQNNIGGDTYIEGDLEIGASTSSGIFEHTLRVSKNYIVINGKRLYLAADESELDDSNNIPEGSVWIKINNAKG